MEGDDKKKSGSKKRSKMISVGFDSPDDEPIGNLFNLKIKKKPRKAKDDLGSSGEKEKEMVIVGEDLGGLDDTLASLRKKLKGPKKGSLGLDLSDLSEQPLDELASDVGVRIATEKLRKVDDKDGLNASVDNEVVNKENSEGKVGDVIIANGKSEKVIEKDGLNAVIVYEKDNKEKSKRSKSVKKVKKNKDRDNQGSRIILTQSGKVHGLVVHEGSDLDLNKNLDDSSSDLLREAQSAPIKKSGNNYKIKPKRKTQTPKDENSSVIIANEKSEKVVNNGELNAVIEYEVDNKESSKRSDSVKKVKRNKNCDNQGSRILLTQSEEVHGLVEHEGSNRDLNKNLDDSSSDLLREAQLVPIKKSRNNSEAKPKRKTQTPKDGHSSVIIANDKSEKVVDKDELNAVIVYELDTKEKSKRCKSVRKVKKNNNHDNQGSGIILSQSEKVHSLVVHEGSNPDLNKNLDDSAYDLLREAQSVPTKKSGNNSKTKLKRKNPTPKDGNSSKYAVTNLQVVDAERSLCSLLGSPKAPKLNRIPTNSTIGHENIGVNTSSDDHMENTSTTANVDMKIKSSTDRDEIPHSTSSLKIPISGLNGCSIKRLGSNEGVIDREMGDNLHLLDSYDTDCPRNGNSEELLSDKLRHNCSLQSRVLTPIMEETCEDHDGFDPPSRDMLQNSHVTNDDVLSIEANEASSPSVSPDRNGNYEEDKKPLPSHKSKDKKLPEVLKRKTKKRRHDDMAYEGDVDWDVLIHEQGFPEYPLVEEDDLSLKENGAAAVSAGLKARAVGPVEKIKFKDILKRKGGLQEYLKCRNQILALWSKDVTRILPLTECGVTASPLVDEPPRDSLIREIYEFLNQSGYINVGIASEKEATELCTCHNLRLIEEKAFRVKADDHDADADDGVSFILGQVKTPEAPMAERSNNILDDDHRVEADAKEKNLDVPHVMGMSTILESGQCQTDELLKNISSDPMEMLILDDVVPVSFKARDNEGSTVVKMKPVQSSSSYTRERESEMECVSDGKKRIIVIGAGPAGLTAARHLQHHGFSVDVLEARDRVGGRVYTDRSSLSVPVDLGASIITGVEADVATERRADPSSLICAQLGLELTVLKSDCPLYDVVTGQKVPAELDEALEAEYNTLLDDVPLLVVQKGERGTKMSLEDGLEHALKGRRMAQLGRSYKENELGNFAVALDGSVKDSVDGKVCKNDSSKDDVLSPLERRVMNWHFAHLEYGCAALLQDVSLPYWNQDDAYGGFGGAHCMIKGGYSAVVESLGEGLSIHLNHIVTSISYSTNACTGDDIKGNTVKVCTSNGIEFLGDAVLITVPLGCLKARDIDFSPPLPHWKDLSIQRLGFGVLNKVVMEFPNVFWDESVDYFGATAEETDLRGKCFMFWNIKKTVGAPVLIALVVGKAAIEGQKVESSDLVDHALAVLVKLFGKDVVPEPIASVVTDWGNDPFSYGAYSYVAIGASGEDYDILGRPVENCLFFAGEATCKEYPDTVGGAMLSGLREAVRIIDLIIAGHDYTAEAEALEAARRHLDSERKEAQNIVKRLEAIELSNAIYKNTLDGARAFTRKSLLRDMFGYAKTTAGRLVLAKELLNLPVEALKSFAGTKAGLSILNTWILDSMGKDGTQLLRHCVRILVLVSTDLLAVRLSGIGKTIKEKVCVHTSRDIRAIASQLVNVWVEVFRRDKASNGGLKLLRQSIPRDSLKSKSLALGKVHPQAHGLPDNKRNSQISATSRSYLPPLKSDNKRVARPVKLDSKTDSKMAFKSSKSQGSVGGEDLKIEEGHNSIMSEEEKVAFAAAESARAAALAAAEAYASSEANCKTALPLPKIPSFHKFARREQYTQIEEFDVRKNWSGATLGRQDCTSEIDSRNCIVRDLSVAFPVSRVDLENPNNLVDNLSQRSHFNEIAGQLNLQEQSGESAAVDSSIYTKAWVDGCGSDGLKDCNAIDRWQSQAAAAEAEFYHKNIGLRDEHDSVKLKPHLIRKERVANESFVSQLTDNKELIVDQPRGPERIKKSVVDFVASLLMPLYAEKKIDRDGYKLIMKKTAAKVMEKTTDAEKGMAVYQFLDFKRKSKIRAFVDELIEKHMGTK